MDDKQFIVEVIKYAAWPIVVTVSVFILKDKIIKLFGGGIKSAKHGDTEVQFFEGKQPIKTNASDDQNLHNLIPIDPTGLREEVEQKIKFQLSQVPDEHAKIDILVKNLAQQQIANVLEKIYYYIFGSQIRLLEFLSVQADGKSDTLRLTEFFEKTKADHSETFEDMQFSDYMNFLVTWELVRNVETEWEITKHGRAFITYITAMQLDKNKSL